jgi:hypothetical protein
MEIFFIYRTYLTKHILFSDHLHTEIFFVQLAIRLTDFTDKKYFSKYACDLKYGILSYNIQTTAIKYKHLFLG